jgi:putative acetyltransferase
MNRTPDRHVIGTSGLPQLVATLRLAETRDSQDLFGLITLCFAQYPGCFTDPHDDLPDLVDPGSSYAAKGGHFLVLEDESSRIAACIALDFPEERIAELHRLYVRPDWQGRSLGRQLVAHVEELARRSGAGRMILWSDTRFSAAHALYAKLGYRRGSNTRSLGDISQSREFFFEKML